MFGKLRFSRTFLGLSLAAGFLSIVLSERRFLKELEWKSYDFRLRCLQRTGERNTSIVIVLIDEEDIRRYGEAEDGSDGWPLPRDIYARLIDTLSTWNAKVIGLDLLFWDPDASAAENDTSFALAMRRAANVILPFTFDCQESRGDARNISRFGLNAVYASKQYRKERRFERVCVPLSLFCDAARGMGFIGAMRDGDGVLRTIPLVSPYKDWLFPNFDTSIMCEYWDCPCDKVVVRSGGIRFIDIDGKERHEIPIDDAAQMLLSFRQAQNFKEVCLRDVFERHTPGLFRDRIALIGVSAPNLNVGDLHPTPVHQAMPGVTIHACAISDILSQNLLTRTGTRIHIALTIFVCLLMSLLMPFFFPAPHRNRPGPSFQEYSLFVVKGLILAIALALAYSIGVVAAFTFGGRNVQWIQPVTAIVLIYGFVFVSFFAPRALLLLSQKTAASVKRPELSRLFYFAVKGGVITVFFLIGYGICHPPREYAFYTFLLYLSVLGLLNSKDVKEFLKKIK